MICSKCGTEVVEGAKFCTSCGNRVDNIVVCPVCETENDKNFTFCFACGSRLDGKRFCKNCNTEILENYTFCPNCGKKCCEQSIEYEKEQNTESIINPKAQAKELKVKKIKQPSTEKGFFRLEKILTPSLLMIGLLILAVASFFIGIRLKIVGGNQTASVPFFDIFGVNADVFYFFGDAYREAMAGYPEFTFANVYLTQKLAIIIQTVVYSINILLSVIMLILGFVKYCSGLLKGQKVAIGKYFAWSVSGFLFSVGLMISNGFYINLAYSEGITNISIAIKTLPNIFTLISIIVTFLVGVGAFGLNLVAQNLKDFNIRILVKKLLAFISVIFIIVSLISICKSYFMLVDYEYYGLISDIGFGVLFIATLHGRTNLEIYSKYYAEIDKNLMFKNPIGAHEPIEVLFILFALLIIAILLSLAMAFSIKSAIGKRKRPVLPIIFTALASAGIIVAMVFLSDLANPLGDIGLSGEKIIQGPILELVFTLLALGVSIACVCINTKKQIEE